MQSVPNFSLAIALLMCLVLSNPANAWSGGIPAMGARSFAYRHTRSSPKVDGSSSLGYKIGVTDEGTMKMVATAVSAALPVTTSSPEVPSKWDLPRHSPSTDDAMKEKLLWDVEMTLGRVSMVTAVFLLFGEIFTGQSMADQVTRFLA
jgi:hypothetical protein